MALTRDFKMTVRERLQRDPSFRQALLKEAVNLSSVQRRGRRVNRCCATTSMRPLDSANSGG